MSNQGKGKNGGHHPPKTSTKPKKRPRKGGR